MIILPMMNANTDPSFIASAKKEHRSILRSLGEEGTEEEDGRANTADGL